MAMALLEWEDHDTHLLYLLATAKVLGVIFLFKVIDSVEMVSSKKKLSWHHKTRLNSILSAWHSSLHFLPP